ncbi:MAG TPA: helix-turn-helix domain-containing protein [Acidimicrobiales bacterium]|nr:helix-turn-helix domain-containing protein [Acidimicrobiales bacterium]
MPGAGSKDAPAVTVLLRVREVAEALAVSNMTVYRLIRDGQLAAIRVGHGWRVPETALDEYLSRGVRS